ncbi:YicC family protein [Defluviimonas aestuarii]|uniref:YicC/YloC family endoribonuclease n=1 Tax=Albidovulum aestuarii TaxID=1130726 RepID=UPI002499CC05|nr:YicC/YloC family endoribonuclease [Defluviimonas aestuarii]MDI3337283.1 YicC family protein [Defluviimonas aestuarii]
MVNACLVSMTGFATRRGEGEGFGWTWDVRSVNGKGFDLRLRLPDWIDGLEPAVRAAVAKVAGRGNITLTLKLARDTGSEALRVNAAGLDAVLTALTTVRARAEAAGLELATPSTAEILALRGVTDQGGDTEETGPLLKALLNDLTPLLSDFAAMRAAEGRALGEVISGQIARIETLTTEAKAAADARRPEMERTLRENLAQVLAGAAEADPARVAQELALLAVKADVTEELDRLSAHIDAARELLAEPGAVGRKLDFLMQEFMREANTLCSKSGNAVLTRIGLDLKTVIDQMREQVQNVE